MTRQAKKYFGVKDEEVNQENEGEQVEDEDEGPKKKVEYENLVLILRKAKLKKQYCERCLKLRKG